jgi:hypothetical protein
VSLADEALVFKAQNAIEARALAAHLSGAGVDAHVVGGALDNVFGLPNLEASSAEVWVRGEDRGAAEEIIDAWRREHERPEVIETSKPQFALKTLLFATAVVALVAATSRLFPSRDPEGGADVPSLINAAVLWFWVGLIGLSIRAAYRRMVQRDASDDD